MYRSGLFPVDLEHADDRRNALPVMAAHRPRAVRVSCRAKRSLWLVR